MCIYIVVRVSSRSLSACVIVAVSCIVWTGAISTALVHFFHLPAAVGWTIAGFLALLATMAVSFIFHGIKHATFLVDHPDPGHTTRSDLSAKSPISNGEIPR